MPAPVQVPRGVRRRVRRGEAGQSMVEFALILTPLLLVLMGIIQFGFIFNTYVTVANATREAARSGTIYVYDRTLTQAQNDSNRNAAMRTTLLASLNFLSNHSPQLVSTTTWTLSGSTYTNGDLTVTYTLPTGVTANDPRAGYEVTFQVKYHQDLLIPLVSKLLPKDSGGRLALTGAVTMVIN